MSKLHNTYIVELFDEKGKLKQRETFTNTTVPQGMKNSLWPWPTMAYFSKETTLDDLSKMNNQLFTCTVTKISGEYLSDNKYHAVFRGELPATSQYVGDFSCIATGTHNNYYSDFSFCGLSKSLVKDAEGNVITIHKTDLDTVVVTIHLYAELNVSDKLHPEIRSAMYSALANGSKRPSASYSLISNKELCKAGKNATSTIIRDDKSKVNPVIALGSASRTNPGTADVTFTRVARTVDSTPCIFNDIVIGSTSDPEAYLSLPNSDILPTFTLAERNACVIKGGITDYPIPVPYFVKNTEILKVGERVLQRDVDYTIDNLSTYNGIEECNPWSWATREGGAVCKGTIRGTFYTWYPIAINNRSVTSNITTLYSDADGNGELIFKKPENTRGFHTKVNYFSIAGMAYGYSCSEYSNLKVGAKFTLSYSNDKSSWVEAASLVVPSDYTIENSSSLCTTFKAVDATYWKISVTGGNPNTYFGNNNVYFDGFGTDYTHRMLPGFGYKGVIHFITELPADSIVTFQADMDRVYKDGDYVIDGSGSVSVTI